MVFDFDDFGCNYKISDACASHDCRDKLDELHYMNGNFKVTLFAIPAQMTPNLIEWCDANKSWVELAWHGFTHSSNWECAELTYEEFSGQIEKYLGVTEIFVKGFKAPGWQISDGAYKWLKEQGWWVADQAYNDDRRPEGLKAYVIRDEATQIHGHTWGEKPIIENGIYDQFEYFSNKVKEGEEFKFVSESCDE